MERTGGIYRVSVPLTAGAVFAALLCSRSLFMQRPGILAGLFLLVLCLLFYVPLSPSRVLRQFRGNQLLWIAIFFLCGCLCYSNSVFLHTEQISGPGIFNAASAFIADTIDAIPFRHKENNALLRALVIGDRSALPRAEIQNFRAAGAAHLLALSGMHLGIIYVIVNRLLGLMGNRLTVRKIRSVIVIAATLAYTLMCGAGPSLMRAWLFILLNESAKILGRPQPPRHVFCAALLLHVIVSPQSINQIGFQLSYLAMAGICFLWPYIKEWYNNGSLGAKIWQGASLALCCQLFTGPLSWYYFGTFPKFFLLTNLIAAPLTIAVMVCGISGIVITAVYPAPELILLLEYPLTWLRAILEAIASL